jgi:hypothetical protein
LDLLCLAAAEIRLAGAGLTKQRHSARLGFSNIPAFFCFDDGKKLELICPVNPFIILLRPVLVVNP